MRGSLTGAAAVCAAAALLAGCGSSSGSSPSAQRPQAATLTRAAYVSSTAPGYRAIISLNESAPSVGTITASGTGSFRLTPKHEGSMSMQLKIPAAASSGLGILQMQAVFVPNVVYLKLPPQLARQVPGGKPWLSINLTELGKAEGIPGLGALANSSSSLNNPAQYVSYLRATTDGTVRNLGRATINGVQTTHYHAVIDLNKLANVVPASSRASVQQLVATLKKRGTKTQLPIDAWIDSSQKIRRVVITYSEPINGQKATITTRVDFVQYGPQPAPTVPPKGETQDLLSLAGKQP
jgi:hypothetical protein